MNVENMSVSEILNHEAEETLIYNYNSEEDYKEAKILCGKPSGIMNFNETPHPWAVTLFDSMHARDWSPNRINVNVDALNYPQLSPVEKRAYDLVLAQLITNDSVQTQQLAIGVDKYITSPVVNCCISRQAFEECCVPWTMVLHEQKGWVRIDEIEVGDRIYSCDENLIGKFTEVTHMSSYDFNGKMVKISGINVSQIVTPNHRILYRDRNNKMRVDFAKNLVQNTPTEIKPGEEETQPKGKKFTKGYFPNTINFHSNGVVDGLGGDNLDAWSRFLVALQADGHIARDTNPNNHEVVFELARERKIKRLKTILDDLGFYYKVTPVKGTNKFKFYIKIPTSYRISKFFKDVFDLSKFSQTQARDFVFELFQWDGWDYNYPTKGYDTTVYENALFATAVSSLAGFRSWISVDEDPRSVTYSDLYRVHINTGTNYTSRGSLEVSDYLYTGPVYCPTVEGSFFLCMLDGKVSITGNSLHSRSYTVMAEDVCKNTKDIYRLHKNNPELERKNKAVADMYDRIYKDKRGEKVTIKDVLLAFVANQILEELVFPGGFATMYTLEDKMKGTSEMIAEINSMGLPTEQSVA